MVSKERIKNSDGHEKNNKNFLFDTRKTATETKRIKLQNGN